MGGAGPVFKLGWRQALDLSALVRRIMFSSRVFTILSKFNASNGGFQVESMDMCSCKIRMVCDDGILPVTMFESRDKLRMFFTVDIDRFSVFDTNHRHSPDLNNCYLICAYDKAWSKTMRVQGNAYDYKQVKFILEHLSRTRSFVARSTLEEQGVYASA